MRADPTYYSNLVVAINNATGSSNQYASELSSGLRVNSLSDDPTAAAQSFQIGNQIERIDTYVSTASNVASKMQVMDSTLGEVVSQLTSAITLAVGASNDTLNNTNLVSIANQVAAIRDNILALANGSYQGVYLFAGSKGDTAPFTLDTSTTPASVTYNGDSNVQSLVTPGGQQIQTSLPGDSIFGSGTTGVLGVLNQLVSDLSSGASTSTITADSNALNDALGNVTTERSLLDNSLSTVQSTSTYAQTQESQLKVQQGTLVGSDPVAVATGLKSSQTQYEALLSTLTALQKQNLFDYL